MSPTANCTTARGFLSRAAGKTMLIGLVQGYLPMLSNPFAPALIQSSPSALILQISWVAELRRCMEYSGIPLQPKHPYGEQNRAVESFAGKLGKTVMCIGPPVRQGTMVRSLVRKPSLCEALTTRPREGRTLQLWGKIIVKSLGI